MSTTDEVADETNGSLTTWFVDNRRGGRRQTCGSVWPERHNRRRRTTGLWKKRTTGAMVVRTTEFRVHGQQRQFVYCRGTPTGLRDASLNDVTSTRQQLHPAEDSRVFAVLV